MTYWNNKGKYTPLYEELTMKLVPEEGRAPTQHGELLSAIGRVYYDWFNNGGINYDNPRFKLALYTIRSWHEEIDAKAVKAFSGTRDLIDKLIRHGDHLIGERSALLTKVRIGLELERLTSAVILVVQEADVQNPSTVL